jgi:hypothetical protein
MLVDFFAKSPVLLAPVIALVIFLVVFGTASLRVWRRGAKAYHTEAALPLFDGEENGHE